MKIRPLGSTGLSVSELCLSASNFARHANQSEAFAMLDAFHAAGGTMIQTTGICPGFSLEDSLLGLPERLVGRWLNARGVPRRDIVIATRVAPSRPVIGGAARYAELVESCARDSVQRIGCGYLDLLLIEWTDAVLPFAESLPAFHAVVRSGVAHQIGAAHFPIAVLREGLNRTLGADRLSAVQEDYSLVYRAGYEGGAARLCGDFGVGFIARSPLAGGRLVAYPPRELGSFSGRVSGHAQLEPAVRGIWPVLAAIARSRGCQPAQVALAWVLARREIASVLVSARSLEQLRVLCDAADLELSAEELRRLEPARPAAVPGT